MRKIKPRCITALSSGLASPWGRKRLHLYLWRSSTSWKKYSTYTWLLYDWEKYIAHWTIWYKLQLNPSETQVYLCIVKCISQVMGQERITFTFIKEFNLIKKKWSRYDFTVLEKSMWHIALFYINCNGTTSIKCLTNSEFQSYLTKPNFFTNSFSHQHIDFNTWMNLRWLKI